MPSEPRQETTRDDMRVALFTDLLVYDYSCAPPEHPDAREVHDLRQQADWLVDRGWITQSGAVDLDELVGRRYSDVVREVHGGRDPRAVYAEAIREAYEAGRAAGSRGGER